MPIDDSEPSLNDGGTFAGQPKVDRDDVSLGGEATFAGASRRRAAEMSLGDERTFGDRLDDQETVIGDIEVVDLATRYKTEGTLGRGGMGEVLLALDTRLDRKVAIKRILGEAARSKTAVSRFLTEAKAIAALNHPNVVQIYDYGRAEDGPFLIMEYVDGSSLLDRCRDGALPLEEAVNLACQLCDGLGKAHDLGIVHRDIKPANVLLTKDGLPKLTDFGLAKAEATDHQMTMTGAVLGTPDFMPPEQRKDAALVDARSDLWSLAATVYQMVTGRSPKIIRFDLLPAGLTDVLGKALEEAKEDRFQTARELRDALKASLVATAPASAELSAGQCPSCGIKNDSSRRFCRGCGESLEAPCLSCSKPMPMWEEICGQCGTKQGPLLEERRGDMAAQQAEAEGLLKDHDFERAEGIAVALRDESDPRFKQHVPWATTLLPRIATARDAQLAEAAARLAEANKHEASFDYPSAIAALELVPQILRKQSLAGHPGNISTALARLSGKQVEVARLESWVKNQIAARELSGLLPEVKKLRNLRPDRSDVQKLCAQLEERQQKLVAQRDDAVAIARSRLDAKDYESALAVLRKIDRTVETPETEQMRATADATLRRLQSMIAMIRLAVADKRLDGLIPQVKDALSLKHDHPDLIKLLESLNARETKVGVGIDNLIANAAKAFVACKFDTAVTTLRRIPEDRRTRDITDRLDQAEYLAIAKSGVVAGFESVQNLPDLSKAEGVELAGIAARGRSYLAQLAAHDLSDSVIEQWCAKCEAAAEARLAVDRAYQWLTTLRHAIFHVRARLVDTLKPKTRLAPDFPDRSPARSNATAIIAGAAALGISAASLIALGYFIVGVWQTRTITNSIGMQFVEIPQGKYYRKIKRTVLAQDNKDLFVRSIVNIEKPFWICRTEVTQAQWNAVMPTSPWSGQPETIDRPQQPATYITQSDAIVFCDRLTAMERKTGNISPIAEYRLPTENEWEYSCRAGTASTYYAGEDSGAVATYEWCRGAVRGEDSHHPMDVALKRPTRWGLYDAFGNVREICSDHVRGGCWTDPPEKCTTWRNTNASPDDGNSSTGFRVVLIGGE